MAANQSMAKIGRTHPPDGKQELEDGQEQTHGEVDDEPERHFSDHRGHAFVPPKRAHANKKGVPHRRSLGELFAPGHLRRAKNKMQEEEEGPQRHPHEKHTKKAHHQRSKPRMAR